jgi:hypothetical protein
MTALVYVSYGGVISVSPEAFGRMASGGTLTADDMYFVTTPVFQTAHERYAWLNHVQAIGKVVAVKGGDQGFVRYDVYAVRGPPLRTARPSSDAERRHEELRGLGAGDSAGR